MCDLGVHAANLTDEQEDTYFVGDHGKGIPLGHALLVMQEVAKPIHISHHQSDVVAIAVQGKLRVNRPLKLDSPQH